MSAAPVVLESAVFHIGGVVRVSGSGDGLEVGIVAGAGVSVVDHSGYGSTAGEAVINAPQEFRLVLFLAGCGPVVLSGGPAVKKGLQFFKIHGKPRRNAVQHHADGGSVGLAEYG